MLVGAGHEEDVAAAEALEARDRVGRDRLIGMAYVRRTVGIADRGGDVEGVSHSVRCEGTGLRASPQARTPRSGAPARGASRSMRGTGPFPTGAAPRQARRLCAPWPGLRSPTALGEGRLRSAAWPI